MAFKSVFSPELRGKLAEKQRYLATAQKAVSQFARFPGPDGRYYFRLAKVTAGTDRKTGGYKFNFKFICVASVESRSPEFAGSPMNITFRCFNTPNSTEEENWGRFYTDGLQALGIPTNKWPADQAADLLDQALGMLNDTKPPVVLQIRSDLQYQNANITEVLREDALDEFTQPSLEVDDHMPEDESDESEGPAGADEQLLQLKMRLEGMGAAELIAAIANQNISAPGAAKLTDPQLREVIYKHFEAQLKPPASPPEEAPAEEPVEESLEEPVEEDTEASLATLVTTTIASMERKPIQQYIKKLDPTFKFFVAPTHTDNILRQTLLEKLGDDEAAQKAFLTACAVPF